MTRKSLRNKVGSAELENGSLLEKESGPVQPGATKSKESLSKAVNGLSGFSKKKKEDPKEVPLKERLKELREKEKSLSGEVNHEGSSSEKASTSSKDLDKKSDDTGKDAEKGESLAVLLEQGLTSGDAEKIDAVLARTDVYTITATLNDLPITQIVPLLKQIEYRLKNRNPLDIRCWIRWVQYIISMHMAYLSTLETLEDELKGLFEWMRSRTRYIGKLCELYGKLALVTEQAERRANPKLFILQEPRIFYSGDDVSSLEDSEDLDDLEDETLASNDEWWDDEEIASDDPEGDVDAQGEGSSSSESETSSERKTDDDSDSDKMEAD